MADRGLWTGGALTQGALPVMPTWAAPSALFPTQVTNPSSIYTYVDSTGILTLPSSGLADGYLIIASMTYEDTSNGRHMPQLKVVQASGTGNFLPARAGGTSRDNSENEAYVRTWAFVDAPSTSATFGIQWTCSGDTATGGTQSSALEVIPLYYKDVALFGFGASKNLAGGTTPVVETNMTEALAGTNISHSSGVVTLEEDNTNYLVIGGQWSDGAATTRTQRWYGIDIDGVQDDSVKACVYLRDGSNHTNGNIYTTIIPRVTTDITIENTCYRGDGVSNNQGGADTDSGTTATYMENSMVVLALNDSAEVFKTTGTSVESVTDTTARDLTYAKTGDIDFNDSASFTRTSDTEINLVKAGDYLLGANISGASSNVSNTLRTTAYTQFSLDGTDNVDTKSGNYCRHNQGTIDTFGWSSNMLSAVTATAGQDLTIPSIRISGGESGPVSTNSGWVGVWGVNLDTLEASTEVTGTGALQAQSATMSGTGTVAGTTTGTGALQAQSATMSGTGEIETTGTGALQAQSATMSGAGAVNLITDVFTDNGTVQNASEDNKYTGMSDVKIRSGANSGNNYNNSDLSVNKYGGATDHDITLIKFDGIAANISSSASIISAKIYLKTLGSNTSTFDVDTHRLIRTWSEATATFDDYDGTNPWGTGGARGDAVDRIGTATATTAIDGTVGNWTAIDVTSDVQDIVDGTIATDYGWMNDRTTSGNDSVYITYDDSEGVDGDRPELVVEYTVASTEVTGTGALQAQSATMSGTAEREVTGTGALQAQSATMSGTGAREISGTGTLQAQPATISGTGARDISGTGALQAQPATMSGTGEISNTGTGALQAQSATMSGTAERKITGTGALQAQPATLSGTGSREISGTGALQAQSATMAGTGTTGAVISGTGALQAQSATMSGTGIVERKGTGALQAQPATISGSGEREVTSSGALQAQPATMSGTGTVATEHSGTGALQAQPATISGTGEIGNTGTGALQAQSATMSGTAERIITGTGALQAQPATMSGTAFIYIPAVECNLVDREGNALPNLTLLSWAWFDETDPIDFIAPTDTGETETTNGSGFLSIEIPNTLLVTGQTGTLILRSNSGVSYAAYNLEVI